MVYQMEIWRVSQAIKQPKNNTNNGNGNEIPAPATRPASSPSKALSSLSQNKTYIWQSPKRSSRWAPQPFSTSPIIPPGAVFCMPILPLHLYVWMIGGPTIFFFIKSFLNSLQAIISYSGLLLERPSVFSSAGFRRIFSGMVQIQ